MNINIKENPNVTLKNCKGYTQMKESIRCVVIFQSEIYNARIKSKSSINSIKYPDGNQNIIVRLTKTGNIVVERSLEGV